MSLEIIQQKDTMPYVKQQYLNPPKHEAYVQLCLMSFHFLLSALMDALYNKKGPY